MNDSSRCFAACQLASSVFKARRMLETETINAIQLSGLAGEEQQREGSGDLLLLKLGGVLLCCVCTANAGAKRFQLVGLWYATHRLNHSCNYLAKVFGGLVVSRKWSRRTSIMHFDQKPQHPGGRPLGTHSSTAP